MAEVSLFRLYALRAGYLLLVVGLGLAVWPQVLNHEPWTLSQGVVKCMLAALPVLALLGLRHPLKMLPLLLFEVAWKAIWLSVVALPAWRSGQMDADVLATTWECLVVVLIVAVIPWGYVARQYLGGAGERWVPRRQTA
ncbi:hypothetical protein [Caulobacter sp. 17J65-9]|uniref:hypothetical protein n=1 Tax=Caulobacter sp. 17J65-9 TaxID=2709382 RepID=UPI0013C92510|nr:hypothetical protein [Caulobacter sp. 17J65-9]NEX95100.1 hypothetical protein [Caulobacter sp. 17J65-9]